MQLAEANNSVRNFQELQSFISKSVKKMIEHGHS